MFFSLQSAPFKCPVESCPYDTKVRHNLIVHYGVTHRNVFKLLNITMGGPSESGAENSLSRQTSASGHHHGGPESGRGRGGGRGRGRDNGADSGSNKVTNHTPIQLLLTNHRQALVSRLHSDLSIRHHPNSIPNTNAKLNYSMLTKSIPGV